MPVITLTNRNFDREVLGCQGMVLVGFRAGWCEDCRALAPVIEEVAGERGDVKVGTVDVNDQQELTMRYRVMALPTLLVFRGGQLVKRESGGKSREEILELLR